MGKDSAGPQPFPSTHWSIVERLRHPEDNVRRAAMGELLNRYLGPLKSHLLSKKQVDPQQVDDLLQSFVSRQVLERDLVQQADASRGRLRTYLATALDRFVINAMRDAAAKKRSPGKLEPLNEHQVSRDHPPAGATFDLEWAHQVLREALKQMETECTATGRANVWALFDLRVVGPILRDTQGPGYAELVQQLDLVSPSHASNMLVTAKRMFVRTLRSVIAGYGIDEADIDDEIDDLWRILAKSRP